MPIDFTPTESQRTAQLAARVFAREHLSEIHTEIHTLPTPEARFGATRPAYEKMVADGWLRAVLPSPVGDAEGLLDAALIAEELACEDVNVTLTVFANLLGLFPLVIAGSEEQQQKWLPPFTSASGAPMCAFAFSEVGGSANFDAPPPAQGTRTTAVLDGDEWVITGMKQWNSNATGWDGLGADLIAIVCRTSGPDVAEGISVIMAERSQLEAGGFRVAGSHDTPGHRGHLSPVLEFDGLRVPKHNLIGEAGNGQAYVEAGFGGTAAIVGAFAVGVMRKAFDIALDFTKHENRGGPVKIIEHQAVGYLLADVKTKIEASRYLVWKACHALDTEAPGSLELAVHAKIFGSESSVSAIYDLMRTVGIESYSHDMRLAALLQDAICYPLFDGGNVGVRRRQLHTLFKADDYSSLTAAEGSR
jgi:nitroalkane oxidase